MPDHGLIIDEPTIIAPGADGGSRPVQRGVVVDKAGAARVLERLLGRRAGLGHYSMVVLTTPVLCPGQHKSVARAALEVLDARVVLTIDGVKAAALGSGADVARPLLVLDIGAGLTEVGLLMDGGVTEAVPDLPSLVAVIVAVTVAELVQSIVAVVTGLLHLDCGGLVVDALDRGPLLTGGGALRPEITYGLTKQLLAPVRPAPAPHTAAVRGAGLAMVAAPHHPSILGEQPH